MSAGYQITRTDLDNTMGRLVMAVRESLEDVRLFKAMLDDTAILTDALLQGAPISYSSTETTLIRASFADLTKLRDISFAQATQSPANDFWFNAKRLTGIAL